MVNWNSYIPRLRGQSSVAHRRAGLRLLTSPVAYLAAVRSFVQGYGTVGLDVSHVRVFGSAATQIAPARRAPHSRRHVTRSWSVGRPVGSMTRAIILENREHQLSIPDSRRRGRAGDALRSHDGTVSVGDIFRRRDETPDRI
jgi:hypothetical protein